MFARRLVVGLILLADRTTVGKFTAIVGENRVDIMKAAQETQQAITNARGFFRIDDFHRHKTRLPFNGDKTYCFSP